MRTNVTRQFRSRERNVPVPSRHGEEAVREALAADSAILAQNAGCHALDDDPATCHDPLQSRGPCTCAPRIMYLCVRLAVLPRAAIRIFLLGCLGDSANSRPAVTAVAATSGSHLPVRAKINCRPILGGWKDLFCCYRARR